MPRAGQRHTAGRTDGTPRTGKQTKIKVMRKKTILLCTLAAMAFGACQKDNAATDGLRLTVEGMGGGSKTACLC